MKKFIFILTTCLIFSFLISCDNPEMNKRKLEKQKTATGYPIYTIDYQFFVPDLLEKEQRQWILDAVNTARIHHTGGDDADMDDVIRQAERTSDRLFSKKIYYLVVDPASGDNVKITIQQHEMDEEQREIFKILRSGKRAEIKTFKLTGKPNL